MGRVIVDLPEYGDGVVDDPENHPVGLITGQLAALEHAAAQLAADPAVGARGGDRARRGELPPYWGKVLIPRVRYSRSIAVMPPHGRRSPPLRDGTGAPRTCGR